MWDKLLDIYNSVWLVSHVAVPLLIVLLSYLTAKLFDFTILEIIRKYAARSKTKLDEMLIKAAGKTLEKLLLFIGIYIALISIPGKGTFETISCKITFALIILAITFLVIRIFKAFTGWYRKFMAPKTDSDFDDEFIPLLEKIGAFILYTIGLIWILDSLGVNVSALIMSLGVGGLAIGLAAKDALANMIAGFMLMIDRPFRVGDRIELQDGKIGDVVHLGIRSTRIRTFDNTIIIIPNQQLLSNQLINHTYPDTVVKRRIDTGVAYGTNLNKAMDIMLEVCKSHNMVLEDPAPSAFVLGFGDSAVNLTCFLWVADYKDGFSVQSDVTKRIYEAFNKAKIEIPFPIRTLYLSPEDRKIFKKQQKT